MKAIKYTYLMLTILLLGQGCAKEFLEIKPRGKEIASTYEHYEGLLNNFGLCIFGRQGQTMYSFYMSDEFISTERTLNNLLLYTREGGPAAYRYESSYMRDDETTGEWAFTENLYTYNVIIRDVMDAEGGTDEQRLSVLSEARMMRAWIHFVAAQYFCAPYNTETASSDRGLPIVTIPDTMQEEFEMVSNQELYDFIVTEMEASAPHIQNASNYTFRCERGDAYAMLGMVYMYMNRYEDALRALRLAKAAADENGSAFLYDYNQQTEDWVNNDAPMHIYNEEYMRDLYFANYSIMYYSFYVPEPIIYVKDSYMSLFSDGDRRRFRFVQADGDEYHRPIVNQFTMGPTSPDLFILLAECEARMGDEQAARELLTTFRSSRMPDDEAQIPAAVSTRDQLVRFAIDEHIREWMGTGKIWWDMRRLWNDPVYADAKAAFNHPVGSIDHRPQLENLVMPIPKQVCDWNPSWGL